MEKINRDYLIREYIEFFKSKGHKLIPNSSLVPINDPTVLFTTAGMHPLVPYLLGQKHPLGKRLVGLQRCIRTTDIDFVGDENHHTFFEMLGNWSLGDYWKEDAIKYSYEFLTKILKIPHEKIFVTCFKGDEKTLKDTESESIWKSLGIKNDKIKFLGREDNWWGPAGETGPCGPDTEIFIDGFEIWNDVFMEYNKTKIKAILFDDVIFLSNKGISINKEILDLINSYEVKKILFTNLLKDNIKNQSLIKIIKDNGIDLFILEKNSGKNDQKFFERILEKYKLSHGEVIYFSNSKENITLAKKFNIKSELYKDKNQIKKFIDENLYYFNILNQKNVDTGMGVERTLTILNGLKDNYLTEVWLPIIKKIEELSGKKYGEDKETTKAMRIIADHIKAAVFIIADGVLPSNTGRGYVLRRLIRRALKYWGINLMDKKFIISVDKIIETIFDIYEKDYPEIKKERENILKIILDEQNRFNKTLNSGMNIFNKLAKKGFLSGKDSFLLYQSYGFPIELTKEIAESKKLRVDISEFNKELSKHQKLSRVASINTFKSGLLDHSEKTIKLHTATHLLNEALRHVLGKDVKQRGSNITPERLRFDFNFSRKLTEDEIKKIEDLVNKKISEGLEVKREEMPLKEALASGAQSEFKVKYPEIVSVYTIGDFSKEICTGPHVKNTRELGKFRIIKEEAVASGIRRIKAVVE